MQTLDRRGFLASTAGAIGAVLSEMTLSTAAPADEQPVIAGAPPDAPAKEKDIRIGLLTAPFGDKSLVDVLDFARSANIRCLEVVADPGAGTSTLQPSTRRRQTR